MTGRELVVVSVGAGGRVVERVDEADEDYRRGVEAWFAWNRFVVESARRRAAEDQSRQERLAVQLREARRRQCRSAAYRNLTG